jgi:hypothetical protein
MNSRLAKSLRAAAREQTVNSPWCAYQRKQIRNDKGELVGFVTVLHPKCGRAVYKRGKREASRA